MSDDTVFVDGLKFFEKHHEAPDFVMGSISLEPKKLIEWMRANHKAMNAGGYIRVSVLMSRSGKPYCKLDTYEPKPKPAPQPKADDFGDGDDIPF